MNIDMFKCWRCSYNLFVSVSLSLKLFICQINSMKLLFSFACFLFLMTSCNNNNDVKKTAETNGDATFDSVANAYLKGYLDWRPLTAVSLGMHEYDGKVSDYSKASLDKELQRLKEYDQKLDAIVS